MEKPVPDLSSLRRDKSDYRHYPIQPRDEVCIQVDPRICRSYYWHHHMRPEGATEEIFLRSALVMKLERAAMRIQPLGLRLLIQEGYRSLLVQKFVQEVSVLNGLRKENPHLSEAELRAKVSLFAASAYGDLNTSPPPHLTGGAVDLTMVYASTGEQVDMGKGGGLYNTAYPDALESLEGFEEARRFRRLLFWLAHEEGFVVNPTEWWHLSFGDQMWAWINKTPYAVYGQAKKFA